MWPGLWLRVYNLDHLEHRNIQNWIDSCPYLWASNSCRLTAERQRWEPEVTKERKHTPVAWQWGAEPGLGSTKMALELESLATTLCWVTSTAVCVANTEGTIDLMWIQMGRRGPSVFLIWKRNQKQTPVKSVLILVHHNESLISHERNT